MWRGAVSYGRLRLLADRGSVGGKRESGKEAQRQDRACARASAGRPVLGAAWSSQFQPLGPRPINLGSARVRTPARALPPALSEHLCATAAASAETAAGGWIVARWDWSLRDTASRLTRTAKPGLRAPSSGARRVRQPARLTLIFPRLVPFHSNDAPSPEDDISSRSIFMQT